MRNTFRALGVAGCLAISGCHADGRIQSIDNRLVYQDPNFSLVIAEVQTTTGPATVYFKAPFGERSGEFAYASRVLGETGSLTCNFKGRQRNGSIELTELCGYKLNI